MLAAHRTVYDCSAGPLDNCPCGAHRYRTVDNCQGRPVEIDVTRGLADKILDLEWIADMQYICLLDALRGGNVYADYIVVV